MIRRQPFAAVNLISDPIHGYLELTKRLGLWRYLVGVSSCTNIEPGIEIPDWGRG